MSNGDKTIEAIERMLDRETPVPTDIGNDLLALMLMANRDERNRQIKELKVCIEGVKERVTQIEIYTEETKDYPTVRLYKAYAKSKPVRVITWTVIIIEILMVASFLLGNANLFPPEFVEALKRFAKLVP